MPFCVAKATQTLLIKNGYNPKKGDNIMKKIVVGVAVALATLIMCMCFAACSSSVAGTYKFQSMSMSQGGATVEIKVGEQYMGMITLNEDAVVVTLNEDNTVEFKMNMGQEATMTGTWEENDGKYYITIEGETQEVTIKDGTLTMENDGAKIVLKK